MFAANNLPVEHYIKSSQKVLTMALNYLNDALKNRPVEEQKLPEDEYKEACHIRMQRKAFIELTQPALAKKTSLTEVIECLHDLFTMNNEYTIFYQKTTGHHFGLGKLSLTLHDYISFLLNTVNVLDDNLDLIRQDHEAYENTKQEAYKAQLSLEYKK